MNRRRFLSFTLATSLLSALGYRGYMRLDEKMIIIAVLNRKLSKLGFFSDDYQRFSVDFLDRLRDQRELRRYQFRLKILSLTRGFYDLGAYDCVEQMERFEEHVITKFLLSTDYFLRDSPPYRYRQLYDPSTAPCSNVFRYKNGV